MTKSAEVKECIKDIPGVWTIGQKVPLEDLVVYVENARAKRLVEKRLAECRHGHGVQIEVVVFGKIAPIGPVPRRPY